MMDLLEPHARMMRQANCTAGSIAKRTSAVRRCGTHARKVNPLTLTRDDIEAWLDSRTISHRTRYADISHLSAFFRWAIIEEHTLIDPTVQVIRPKMRAGLPRPIPTDSLRTALTQAPDREMLAMLLLASHGGLRCAEIASLTGSDVRGLRGLVGCP